MKPICALLAHQRRHPLEADDPQPGGAPHDLEDRVSEQRCQPVREQARRRQAPLRFRSVRSYGQRTDPQ
jgi:hypothetical protein